jgi:RNA polymerase sigma-70 factor (ECF subfamily)
MMPGQTGYTSWVLEEMRVGNERARDALIVHARDRLRVLASYMLRREFPSVRSWEQTDDVLHNVLIRLTDALAKIPIPCSSDHWWRLANQHLRWELMSLARHYAGPQGLGPNLEPNGGQLDHAPDPSRELSTLDDWAAFHEAVGRLPEEEQRAFGLIWYDGLTQEQAAAQLGISLRTLGRRWRSALRQLARSLRGETSPRR